MKTSSISNTEFKGKFIDTPQIKRAVAGAKPYALMNFENIGMEMKVLDDKKSFCLDFLEGHLSLIVYKDKILQEVIKLKELPKNVESIKNEFFLGVLALVNQNLRNFYPKKYRNKEEDDEIIDSYKKFPMWDFGQDEVEDLTVKKGLPVHDDLEIFYEANRDAELFDKHNDLKEQYYPVYDKNDVPLAENLRPPVTEAIYYNQNNMEHEKYVLEEEIKKPRPKERVLPKNFPSFALDYVRELDMEEANTIYSTIKEYKIENFDEYTKACAVLLKKTSLLKTIYTTMDALTRKTNVVGERSTVFNQELLEFLLKYPGHRNSVVYFDAARASERFSPKFVEDFEKLIQKEPPVQQEEKAEEPLAEETKIIVEDVTNKQTEKLTEAKPEVGVLVNMDNIDPELYDFMINYPNYVDFVISKNGKRQQIFDKFGARLFCKLIKVCEDAETAKDVYEKCQKRIWGGRYNACTFADAKGEILPQLIKNGFTANEAIQIYEYIKDYDVENLSDFTEACTKNYDSFSFDKLYRMVTQSLIKRSSMGRKMVFNVNLMKFLIKCPKDRANAVVKNSKGAEIFDEKRAKNIEIARKKTKECMRKSREKIMKTEDSAENFADISDEKSDNGKSFEFDFKKFEEEMQKLEEELNARKQK